jgi:hypothetical protein
MWIMGAEAHTTFACKLGDTLVNSKAAVQCSYPKLRLAGLLA